MNKQTPELLRCLPCALFALTLPYLSIPAAGYARCATFTEVQQSSSAPIASQISDTPRWTPPSAPPTYSFEADCWVQKVNTPRGKLDDTITLWLYNPEAYFQWAIAQDRNNARSRTLGNLILFLNDRPLPGAFGTVIGSPNEQVVLMLDGTQVRVPSYELEFHLVRTKESNEAWGRLLDRPVWSRTISVSVGFEDLAPAMTNVRRETFVVGETSFTLDVIPIDPWTVCGIVIIITSLIVFLFLANRTDLIRETNAPRKADGRYPFSLARTQMAFWFFLVFATYFFIWVITGDKDTIPASVLGLMGISAATAVGSAFVDSSKGSAEDGARRDSPVAPPAKRLKALVLRRAELALLEHNESDYDAQIATADMESRTRIESAKAARVSVLRSEIVYFEQMPWQVFIYDLLTDDGVISVHRYQIFVWTLVLGVIFLKEVYGKLAMPDFSATLVGLMGISAGTFVTLKLPMSRTDK